jgi:hypothetical protein
MDLRSYVRLVMMLLTQVTVTVVTEAELDLVDTIDVVWS